MCEFFVKIFSMDLGIGVTYLYIATFPVFSNVLMLSYIVEVMQNLLIFSKYIIRRLLFCISVKNPACGGGRLTVAHARKVAPSISFYSCTGRLSRELIEIK